MSTAWPTEEHATLAVEAAAKALFEQGRRRAADLLPPQVAARLSVWDDISALEKNEWRQQVLEVVWPSLQALPDPRYTAWLEGYVAADNGVDVEECPYEPV